MLALRGKSAARSARLRSTLEERLNNTMHPFSTVVEAANVSASVCCHFGVGGRLCRFYWALRSTKVVKTTRLYQTGWTFDKCHFKASDLLIICRALSDGHFFALARVSYASVSLARVRDDHIGLTRCLSSLRPMLGLLTNRQAVHNKRGKTGLCISVSLTLRWHVP